ncbi:hypothetical protein [Hyalangium gracile]|uniref:hypothetical protein n=1 Tax=Hyalangium gracile TaxID=394092 RepID=UPI001CCA3869|nr:hypothetical protein [Hyalangium gracile]
MSRIVWSVGGTGLLAAGALSLWLRQPVELARDEFPAEPLPTAEPRAPGPTSGAAALAASPTPESKAPSSPRRTTSPRPAPAAPPLPSSPMQASAVEDAPSQATRLRHRIVQALRGQYPTPLARRDAVLAEFLSSGESQEPWTQQAREALERWREQISASVLPVRAGPSSCYAAGCLERVTFPDSESYAEAQRRVPHLQLGDVGPHMQLPPEYLPSGEVVVSWAVLRPEAF